MLCHHQLQAISSLHSTGQFVSARLARCLADARWHTHPHFVRIGCTKRPVQMAQHRFSSAGRHSSSSECRLGEPAFSGVRSVVSLQSKAPSISKKDGWAPCGRFCDLLWTSISNRRCCCALAPKIAKSRWKGAGAARGRNNRGCRNDRERSQCSRAALRGTGMPWCLYVVPGAMCSLTPSAFLRPINSHLAYVPHNRYGVENRPAKQRHALLDPVASTVASGSTRAVQCTSQPCAPTETS